MKFALITKRDAELLRDAREALARIDEQARTAACKPSVDPFDAMRFGMIREASTMARDSVFNVLVTLACTMKDPHAEEAIKR